ncbi:MAG: ABC transporter substrate-binding protein [Clostridiales bacterium]|nr:ABC transporter substrate-binding protein [Clostridiales bacterium]
MKKTKKIIALLLAVLMIVGMTACAAKKTTNSDTPTLDAIKERGKLVVLTNASFPPFEYIDGEGNVVGVDIDSVQKMADKLGVKLEIVDMDFDLLIDALKNGKGDIVAAGMTARPDRAEIIDFSKIYISMGLKVIVSADTDIKTFDDLDGKRIAVQEATTADIYAQENYKNAEILAFKSAIDAGNAVKSGNADCAIIDLLPAEYMTANSDEIDLMEGLLSAEDTAMGVAKGHEDLLQFVNDCLTEIMESGSLDASFDSHMVNFSLE